MDNRYPDGAQVQACDSDSKCWKSAIVLYHVRLDEDGNADGWMLEFRNGARGAYDAEHVRRNPMFDAQDGHGG